ncbi:hypothetical protein PIB30_016262 [Stylosanthes scabra]|uniref:Uncharacterized protein n=1 Tax=Stylosanthes scabra TaxID=79078 RepID=A0ABU6Y5K6_9FABA|nr:hypothetical protein [Stylosanthes scabra]
MNTLDLLQALRQSLQLQSSKMMQLMMMAKRTRLIVTMIKLRLSPLPIWHLAQKTILRDGERQRKALEARIDKEKDKRKETGHCATARVPGSNSGGFCLHRATARSSRTMARGKVKSDDAIDRATAPSPPCDRTAPSDRIKMKGKNEISSFWARAKPL